MNYPFNIIDPVPTLVVDTDKCRANIGRMAERARRHGLLYRPHLKTPQSTELAALYRDEGVTCVTVSSLRMAEYFAADGWNDITVAIPVNINETDRINDLASQIGLNLLADSVQGVAGIGRNLVHKAGLFIKVDTGYGRVGVNANDIPTFEKILAAMEEFPLLRFRGFLTHAGHSYRARDHEQIRAVHGQSMQSMRALKSMYRNRYPQLIVSIGDTPCCSVADEFDGADEIRPGNAIFYDLMMQQIGACSYTDIAVAMVCPVISLQPELNRVWVHGGSVHFSKDYITDANGNAVYGQVVQLTENGWGQPVPGAIVSALSQEHGCVSGLPGFADRLRIGDMLGLLPVHSCLSADAMGGYHTTDGRSVQMMRL